MIPVTARCEEEMQKLIRNRGYIQVDYKQINQKAQENAEVTASGELTFYSNKTSLFEDTLVYFAYATLEKEYTKVDGTFRFIPTEGESKVGVVFEKIGDGLPEAVLKIQLSKTPIRVKGMTILFDDIGGTFPKHFDIVCDTGQRICARKNENAKWVTDEILENVKEIEITILSLNKHVRPRIKRIMFGTLKRYTNENVTQSTWNEFDSRINETLPQIDFSVQLLNNDREFDVENPLSDVHFLEPGQEFDVKYGYELDNGEIEWMKKGVLECERWEIENHATIYACDKLRKLEKIFYSKHFEYSLYDLANDVFEQAGIEDHRIDKTSFYPLKRIKTFSPVPRLPCKEVLQLIANASGMKIEVSKKGKFKFSSLPSSRCFNMMRDGIINEPIAIKTERVGEITVPYYGYKVGVESDRKDIINEETTVKSGEIKEFLFDDNYTLIEYRIVPKNGGTVPNAQITVSVYCSKIVFKFGNIVEGVYKIEVNGLPVTKITKELTVKTGVAGKTLRWDNPLIGTKSDAMNLIHRLDIYYNKHPIEYKYDTRGFPQLEAGDIVSYESANGQLVSAVINSISLQYNGGFSGTVESKKIEV